MVILDIKQVLVESILAARRSSQSLYDWRRQRVREQQLGIVHHFPEPIGDDGIPRYDDGATFVVESVSDRWMETSKQYERWAIPFLAQTAYLPFVRQVS